METIWKYQLEPECTLEIPQGGTILSLQVQNNIPCIWVRVNPGHLKVSRTFITIHTGGEIPNDIYTRHVGTLQLFFGTMAHVFENLGTKLPARL